MALASLSFQLEMLTRTAQDFDIPGFAESQSVSAFSRKWKRKSMTTIMTTIMMTITMMIMIMRKKKRLSVQVEKYRP